MAKKRRFSEESFGPTIERLMGETGVTYRALADKTKLSAGYLNHLVHGNRPVPSDKVVRQLAKALDVEPEHFREYRLRVITRKLESMPDLIDRLYKRLGNTSG
jgi:transcriptional regulator with XRE-family HTH domain